MPTILLAYKMYVCEIHIAKCSFFIVLIYKYKSMQIYFKITKKVQICNITVAIIKYVATVTAETADPNDCRRNGIV